MRIVLVLGLSFAFFSSWFGCGATQTGQETLSQESTVTQEPTSATDTASGSESTKATEPTVGNEPSNEPSVGPEAGPEAGPEPGVEPGPEAAPEPVAESSSGPESDLPQPPKGFCKLLAPGVTVGTRVGNYIKNAKLFDCDGNPVSLHDFCGGKAIWLSLHHEWCPHCRKLRDKMESIHAKYEKDGLISVSIVVQSNSRSAPTQSTCNSWRKDGKQVKSFTLYDPTWVTREFWEQNYTALNVFVNAGNVITGKQHTDLETHLETQIKRALGK